MDMPKRPFSGFESLFVVTGVLGLVLLYGCAGTSLGPQEPLLPTIEGQAKFSDRFQLEEEPQFFYDLFGKELLEGSEVYNYRENKEFNEAGELVVGWTGALDSERFSAQLDRTILTEDNFKGRHVEFAIGDDMRVKPATLFPNRYIIYKTEFDGFRWDISFSQERHLFTLLNSRISNPVKLSDAAANLAPTLGRRNGLNEDAGIRHIENARLVGFRAQGLLGDIFRVGFTYMNLHKEHPERIENPMMGTVPNTPPERIVVLFRDDSPEDNHPAVFNPYDSNRDIDLMQGGVGAAFKEMKITVWTRQLEELDPAEMKMKSDLEGFGAYRSISKAEWEELGLSETDWDNWQNVRNLKAKLLPAEKTEIEVGLDEIQAVEGYEPPRDSSDGDWKVADGFGAMSYELNLGEIEGGIDPRTVTNVEFDMVVAGDYNIVVTGYSEANKNEDDPVLAEWIKTEDGHIEMPFRDMIQAPGNYGQSDHYTQNREDLVDNPTDWENTGRPRKVHYQYGAARAAVLYGVDLEGTIPGSNTFVRAHYSINGKYKQYPTVSKDNIGFSRIYIPREGEEEPEEGGPGEGANVSKDPNTGLIVDANGLPTYSDVDGDRFESFLGGDGSDVDGDGDLGRESAWFINLRQRFDKLYLEGAWYKADPGFTTTYLNFGANTDRDATYSLERTPESGAEVDPYDEINYMLIEDDDDDDDWPDDIDFDGVLPQADDRDQNGILDYQEDFLIFEADPPIFEDLVDLNNNGTIDSLEDDYEPQYEYGVDRKGYHVQASYDLLDNMTLKAGWLNEKEVSSARKNDSKYLHLTYQRDIPDFGTILFQDLWKNVQDDIPDYSITLRVGDLEAEQTRDELDFYNARVNTSTLQFLYTAVPQLTLEAKFLVTIQKQFQQDEGNAISLDIEDTDKDERVDYMVPEEQVRAGGDRKEFPFYPDMGINPLGGDTGLIYDKDNWNTRRYQSKTARTQITILKAKYEFPLGDLPYVEKVGEDLTLTPMAKYIWDKRFDRKADEIGKTLNPRVYVPTDPEAVEYLRFNQKSREDVLGARLDYQFTQRFNVLGGFQYRKFSNRDESFEKFIEKFPEDEPIPMQYRPSLRTRILEIQAITRGEHLGFNIVVLAGYRKTTILGQPGEKSTTSNTTFVRAMMGF